MGQIHFPALDLGRPRGLSSTAIMNLTPFRAAKAAARDQSPLDVVCPVETTIKIAVLSILRTVRKWDLPALLVFQRGSPPNSLLQMNELDADTEPYAFAIETVTVHGSDG